MGRMTKLLPIIKSYVATAMGYFRDGSVANSSGSFHVTVGDAIVFSAPASRTLDGPIEITTEALPVPPADYFDTGAEEVIHVGSTEGEARAHLRGVATLRPGC
jgi:hypothetical protein